MERVGILNDVVDGGIVRVSKGGVVGGAGVAIEVEEANGFEVALGGQSDMLEAGEFVKVGEFRCEVVGVRLVASESVTVNGGHAFVYRFVGVNVFGGWSSPRDFVVVLAEGSGNVFEGLDEVLVS